MSTMRVLYVPIILKIVTIGDAATNDLLRFDLDNFGDSAPDTGSTLSQFDYHHGGHSLFHTGGTGSGATRRHKKNQIESPHGTNDRVDLAHPIHCSHQHHDSNKHDILESEYGVFEDAVPRPKRRPRFQTLKSDAVHNSTKWVPLSHIQKVRKSNDTITASPSRINQILKNYMTKLYMKKYSQASPDPNVDLDEDQQSKFLEGPLWAIKNKTIQLKKKFLSLFTVVQFPNSECYASSGTSDYLGICYTQEGCDAMNGTSLGNCAEGYGVCCVYRSSCGESTSKNCTYFESPGYPSYDPPTGGVIPPNSSTAPPMTTSGPTPDPRLPYHYKPMRNRWARQADSTSLSCVLSVYKLSDEVQQMRIDFIDLELRGRTNGTCSNERLVISGQNMNDLVPAICGYNTGSHVYVDVSTLMGPLQLSVLSATGEPKRFKLRVCQIDTPCAASDNCLQYYTGTSGTISSFNYDQAAAYNRSVGGYFNNLNYAICIRKEAGYCSITYTNVMGGLEYPFRMINFDDSGVRTVPVGQAGAGLVDCPDDYVVIGGIRLCGDKFNDGAIIDDFTMNAPVTGVSEDAWCHWSLAKDSSAGPIVVQVRTDGSRTGRGFKLFYMQNPCI